MNTRLITKEGEPVAVTDRPSALPVFLREGPALGVLPKDASDASDYPPDARLLELTAEEKEKLFSRPYWEEAPDMIDGPWLSRTACRWHGRPAVIGETKRLVLRELVPDDAPALMKIYDDPVTRQYVEPLPETEEEVRSQIAAYIRFMYDFYGYGIWGIEEKESGRLIGRAGIEPAEEPGFVSLGYLLAAAARGKGYAREAAQAVVRIAGDELGIPSKKIRCEVAADHEKSLRVAESLGIQVIRREPERIPFPVPDGPC